MSVRRFILDPILLERARGRRRGADGHHGHRISSDDGKRVTGVRVRGEDGERELGPDW